MTDRILRESPEFSAPVGHTLLYYLLPLGMHGTVNMMDFTPMIRFMAAVKGFCRYN